MVRVECSAGGFAEVADQVFETLAGCHTGTHSKTSLAKFSESERSATDRPNGRFHLF